jgi:integral membrane sensor domain MASE1
MEIEELKAIWQQYDSKLDNLERLNKKLIMETLSKKPQKKLNWMKYRSLYALISAPVIIIVALQDYWKIENIDLKFIIGCFLAFLVIVYACYVEFKSFMILKDVDLSNDSIIESARKVSAFKSIFADRLKSDIMSYPILFAGIILIGWKSFRFDTHTILYMSVLFIVALFWGIKQYKSRKKKIDQLHKEILDLNKFIE